MPQAALLFRSRLVLRPLLAIALALLATACGASSKTATAPTPVRCSLDVTVDGASFPPEGGAGTLRISTARECAWSAESGASWIRITTPVAGQGDGSLGFSVAANDSAAARSAAISVNDRRAQLAQQGRRCGFELSSTEEALDGVGGERSVRVDATTQDCAWTAAANVPWLTILAGSEGTGDGAVTFRAERTDGPARTGTVTVAGLQVRVTQTPGPVAPPRGCAYSLVPDDLAIGAAGGPTSIALTTSAECAWTASAHQSWISVGAAAGTGPARVPVIVSANAGPARAGSASIGGRTLGISQANGCTYSVSPRTQSVAPGGGDGSVSVSTAPLCPWSVNGRPPWIQPGVSSGAGPATLGYTALPNLSPDRSATLTVAGQDVTISQPSLCTFQLAPPFHEFEPGGGNGNVLVIVSGPCTWSASTSTPWIRMTAGETGTGDGLVQFVVPPNTGPAREGQITIAGQKYLVVQKGT